MIRVGICDDDRSTLQGLESTISADPELEVVAAVESGENALSYSGPVDVWLIDVRLPGMSGVEVAGSLRASANTAKVLLMTSYDVTEVLNAQELGIGGFIHKGTFLMNVAAAVKAVYAGYQVGNEVVAAALARHLDRLAIVDPAHAARVAKDELDRRLLEGILRSRRVVDMAADVNMSLSGTHKRLQRIFRRAGVENQRALVAWLYRALRAIIQRRLPELQPNESAESHTTARNRRLPSRPPARGSTRQGPSPRGEPVGNQPH